MVLVPDKRDVTYSIKRFHPHATWSLIDYKFLILTFVVCGVVPSDVLGNPSIREHPKLQNNRRLIHLTSANRGSTQGWVLLSTGHLQSTPWLPTLRGRATGHSCRCSYHHCESLTLKRKVWITNEVQSLKLKQSLNSTFCLTRRLLKGQLVLGSKRKINK